MDRARQVFLGHRKAHGIGDPLPQRPGGRLDAFELEILRVPRTRAVQLPKIAWPAVLLEQVHTFLQLFDPADCTKRK